MGEANKKQKNHWTQPKVNEATKKINEEIYKKNRQAPIHIKLDNLTILINDKITRRGIAKGLVFVQEDINKNILEAEKYTLKALMSKNPVDQYGFLKQMQYIMTIEVWTDIRFLMINRAITPGEITELIRRQYEIDKDLEKWMSGIKKAIPAER